MVNKELLDALRYKSEGTDLDFKSQQYRAGELATLQESESLIETTGESRLLHIAELDEIYDQTLFSDIKLMREQKKEISPFVSAYHLLSLSTGKWPNDTAFSQWAV